MIAGIYEVVLADGGRRLQGSGNRAASLRPELLLPELTLETSVFAPKLLRF